jgi:hypothetical protein
MGTKIDEGFNNNFFNDIKSNPFITPPDETKTKTEKIKYVRLLVDSRDRDTDLYPTPSRYEVSFTENITDVCSFELMMINMPFSRYNVHTNNNMLHVMKNSSVTEYVINPGNYADIDDLVDALNDVLHTITVTPTVDKITQKVTFSSTGYFEFHFSNGLNKQNKSIGRLLGFGTENYVSHYDATNSMYVLTAPFVYNLLYGTDYVVMKIGNVKNYIANSTTLNMCTAIINRNLSLVNNQANDTALVKTYFPVMSSFNKLKVAFYDYYGNLYDFNNQEHCFEVKFGLMKKNTRM